MAGRTLTKSLARSIIVLALAMAAVLQASAGTFTDELWNANRDLYQQILRHPFLQGMVSGALDRRTFARYLMQDAYYLREFAVALRAVAAHAPRKEWAALLEQHAQDSLDEELTLHQSVLKEYGVSADEIVQMEPPPDAFAYTSYIVATAHRGSFGEAMSALLPCYWIYREVGKDLKKQGAPDPTYQKWIDAYASPAYSHSVDEVLAIVNQVAEEADPSERARMQDRFHRGFQYEWMFWDAAYRPRAWPGASEP